MNEGLIIETPPFDACEQMAADELLCDTLPSPYTLRFYDWREPAVTFGYSQRIASVKASTGEKPGVRALVRRPTGGGIVFHESDLTFSFIFHQPGAYFEPAKTYDRLHRAIAGAYAASGLGFELLNAPTADYRTDNPALDCFAKPVNLDILYNGKKALGGALRKFGEHMLYQASLQAPDSRTNAGFHRSLVTKALGEEFNLVWRSAGFSGSELEKVKALALSKYGAREWNERI
ncbi:MAG: lipoate--protein ligase family protein [Elusimicrobia bacterium]|nr:lipoate--protein ligase family protein [Elusimicrobiota bacterium]